MQKSKFTTIKWTSQSLKYQITFFLEYVCQIMLPFQCLLIQDFTHFSQKEALLKQRAFMVSPDQPTSSPNPQSLSTTTWWWQMQIADTGRKGFASEIPKRTTKAHTG